MFRAVACRSRQALRGLHHQRVAVLQRVLATRPSAAGAAFAAAAPMTGPSVAGAVPPSTCAVLTAKEDMYGGMIVDPEGLPRDAASFAPVLTHSLQEWRSSGMRGIWLKVPITHAALVPIAVDHGFVFHHAEQEYVMMTHWLPAVPSTLPANASHQIGVGAFIINSKREVLVVQERSGPLKGRGVWKLPTGLVSCGEDLTGAVEREVLEETGIEARFESVLAVRQAHGFAFGKSDLFVLCALRLEQEGQEIQPQESEIVAARWLSADDYLDQEFFKGMPLYMKMMDRCIAWADGRYKGMRAEKLLSSLVRPRMDLLLWAEDPAEDVAVQQAHEPASNGPPPQQ